MTNQTRSAGFRELSQAVAGLTEALAHSERRYHHFVEIPAMATQMDLMIRNVSAIDIQHGLDDGPHG